MEWDKDAQRDKPLVESQKTYHTILEQSMVQAQEELERPALALLISSLGAGLDIGFGPLAMAISSTLLKDTLSKPLLVFLNANLYSIGFIFVVLAHSALFTEHTTSAVGPVLDRRVPVSRLFRLWGIVLFGNLIGATLFAAAASWFGPASETISREAFAATAGKLVDTHWWIILGSGILAGWLMGLLAWLTTAARDTTSQIIFIWLPTFVIGLGHMAHSVAGTVEVLMAVFAGANATPTDFGVFFFWSVLGNAIGGAMMVATVKYAHVTQS